MDSGQGGRARRLGPLTALVTGLIVMVGGCATVPTGGPVQTGRQVAPGDRVDDPYVRVLPTTPQPGWTPDQIVRHFLASSASFADDHRVARQYLAPAVRQQWEPDSGVEVYQDGPDFRVVAEQPSKDVAVVTMEAQHMASIDNRGQYVAAGSDEVFRAKFRLRRLGGEWRIVSFPSGLLLAESDIDRAYRTLNLYFFDPRYQVLVPNPIYVQAGGRDRLPTRLTRALLGGATDWLAPSVRTAFPGGSELFHSVQVSDGVATVSLGGPALGADEDALAYMSAQLTWTLTQLSEVESVRLKLGEDVVSVPNAGEIVSRESWSSLDPDGTAGAVRGYLVQDGRLMVTTQQGLRPAPGPAGSKGGSVHHPAVSLQGDYAGWLTDGRTKLVVSELREGGAQTTWLTGKELRSPSWDRYGNLWVVEGRARHRDSGERADTSPRSRIWMLSGEGEPVRVSAPKLKDRRISQLRIARDGTRVAVVTGKGTESQLLLGRVERAKNGVRIAGVIPLPTELVQVVDVAWRDADRLAVLGKDVEGAFMPYLVGVSGITAPTIALDEPVVSIAAAPGAPMLVALGSGEIRQSPDDLGWDPLTTGKQPAYPG